MNQKIGMPNTAALKAGKFVADAASGPRLDLVVLPIIVWFTTIAYVITEPAPFDLGFFVIVGYWILLGRKAPAGRIPLIAPAFLVLLVLSVLSFANVEYDVNVSLLYVGITIYMYALFLFFSQLASGFGERLVHSLFIAFVVSGAVSALYALLFVAGLVPAMRPEIVGASRAGEISVSEYIAFVSRPNAFFKDPNVFGPFLIPPMMYCMDLFAGKRVQTQFYKNLSIALFVLMALGILLSYSRAAWGGAVISVLLYYMLIGFSTGSFATLARLVFYGLILAILTVSVLTISNSPMIEEISTYVESRASFQAYDEERFFLQQRAFDSGAENFLGIGPGQCEVVNGGSPHNLYLRVFAEQGVLGFAALLVILISTLIVSLRHALWGEPKARSLFLVLSSTYAGFVFIGFFIDPYHWRHFFVLMGLIWGLAARYPIRRTRARLGA